MRVADGFTALHGIQVRTPQKSGLEALWARAGQAGHLRLEVESARVAEQERSLAEAREHLEQWDYLVSEYQIPCRTSHKDMYSPSQQPFSCPRTGLPCSVP